MLCTCMRDFHFDVEIYLVVSLLWVIVTWSQGGVTVRDERDHPSGYLLVRSSGNLLI